MALEHTYAVDSTVPARSVRRALSSLSDDAISESSPVSVGASELAVVSDTRDGESVVVVREEGHDGEWTKTSETAVERAVTSVGGVGELISAEGGYEPDE